MTLDATDADAAEAEDTGAACCRPTAHDLSEDDIADDVRILATAGNATRYEALRLIAGSEGGVCGCELEPALGVTQGAVSQALSRLHAAGLVSRRTEGRWRYYSATPEAERLLDTMDDIRSTNE